MYQATCEAAHDINRHVTALKTWISGELCQKAEQYLSDLSDTARQLQPRIRNQNEILEIILNTIASTCDREQIKLDMDITTIFSNLLDNAVDACMEIENASRTVEIVLCQKMVLIALRITNACAYTRKELPKKRHSTKKNHMGIGLSNVQKTVEKEKLFGLENYDDAVIKSEVALNRSTLGYQRKNLLKRTDTSETKDGVTFTVNEDGSVTANGTATDGIVSYYIRVKITVPDGEYIMSGCPADGSTDIYCMSCYNTSWVNAIHDYGGLNQNFVY